MAYLEERVEKLEEKIERLSEMYENQLRINTSQILTPEEFAEVAKMNISTVYDWVRLGKIRKLPNLGKAIRIPMNQFFEEPFEEPVNTKGGRKIRTLREDFKERVAGL
ncbi:putative transcriptional regulator [Lachnospiraceae bacterium PM6-15]|uniref:helix-turn-helix domain-containing protein n=1 Tax=Ohessyouella blattaphilus TaxID=2949333 RepID=UPI003E1FF664